MVFLLVLYRTKPLIYCCDSVTEICSVANGASKKEIGRAKEFIVKHLEEEMGKSMEMGTIHAGDFLVYFLLFFSLKEKIVILFFPYSVDFCHYLI